MVGTNLRTMIVNDNVNQAFADAGVGPYKFPTNARIENGKSFGGIGAVEKLRMNEDSLAACSAVSDSVGRTSRRAIVIQIYRAARVPRRLERRGVWWTFGQLGSNTLQSLEASKDLRSRLMQR